MKKKIITKIIPIIVALVIALSAIASAAYWAAKTEGEAVSKLTGNIALAFNYDLTPYISYFFPRYPQRLNYITLEIAAASQQLAGINQELEELLAQCDCQNAQSSCRRVNNTCQPSYLEVYGDPCPEREKIEEKKAKIKEKNRHISFLRDLLMKEINSGLENELETLDEDVAQELVTNLEKVLSKSQEIIVAGGQGINLSNQCSSVENCQASCQMKNIFNIKACLAAGTGEQDAISMNLKVKVEVEDLDLGEVSIQNIGLGLPEEINIPELGELSGFTITGKRTTSNVNNAGDEKIYLQTPKAPSLPELPSLNFSCPQYSGSSTYVCDLTQKQKEESIEHEWFYQRYSYLSEKCQELPDMFDQLGLTAEAEECFDQDRLPQKISLKCSQLWAEYCDPESSKYHKSEPPEICQKVRESCLKGEDITAADHCQALYKQENLEVPSECLYEICHKRERHEDCYLGESFCEECDYPVSDCFGSCYYAYSPDFDPVTAIDDLCEEIKAEGRKEQPETCKILPIFSGFIRTPLEENFSSGGGSCSGQIISDFPSTPLGCPSSLPTIPKITLPKIIIPDIVFPTFNISPFLSIKLPNLIFEDLILDDIELCNLDACHGFFPALNFQPPVLTLPEIEIDPIDLGMVSGKKLPSIYVYSIKLPTIPLPLMQSPDLADLFIPEIILPDIEIPMPKVSLSFSGIDLSGIFGYIGSFIANALGIPNQSLCISYTLPMTPFNHTYPDKYFYWPNFPKIPPVDFCKDINSFCQEIRNSFGQLTGQIHQVEETFNEFAQREIQAELDAKADIIKEEIESRIHDQLEAQKERILAEVKEQIDRGEEEITITTEDMDIPGIPLDEFIDLPSTIKIPWPEELKKISLDTPLSHDLPTIPLEELNYEEDFPIKGPGFHSRIFSYGASIENLGACLAQSPEGGNPCPQDEYQDNVNNINQLYQNINEISQEIRKILD